MKKLYFTLGILVLGYSPITAQTAVNFSCNDCAGISHDLFSELDAGKVIVISWVMPCASCVGPTLTASNVVQSYSSSNPGQVLLYVVDDYANTTCSSLNSWCTSNGIYPTATFSNSIINMLDYGNTTGMPKIVVLGGTSHTVFFNEIDAAAGNPTALQAAINAALATGVQENTAPFMSATVFPDPANGNSSLKFDLNQSDNVTIVINDALGQQVNTVFNGELQPGEHIFTLNSAGLPAGIYFVEIRDAENTTTLRLAVSR